MTATQVGVQTQQGNAGINDKKAILSSMVEEAVIYMLGLQMEFSKGGLAMRLDEGDFDWIEPTQLSTIPRVLPGDKKYKEEWKKNNNKRDITEMPRFMQLEVETDGVKIEGITKQALFDVTVSVGEGLPTNKLALFNMILMLSKVVLPDEQTGQMKPILGYNQIRKMIEDMLGIPIEEALEQAKDQTSNMTPFNNAQPIGTNSTENNGMLSEAGHQVERGNNGIG